MKYYLIISLALLGLGSAQAQYISDEDAREINLEYLVFLYDKYKSISDFSSNDELQEFPQLFDTTYSDSRGQILNDVMPDNFFKKRINPEEYRQLIVNHYSTRDLRTDLNVLELSRISGGSGSGRLSAICEKVIWGNTLVQTSYRDTFQIEIFASFRKLEKIGNSNEMETAYLFIIDSINQISQNGYYRQLKVLIKTPFLPNRQYKDTLAIKFQKKDEYRLITPNYEGFYFMKDLSHGDKIFLKTDSITSPIDKEVSFDFSTMKPSMFGEDKNIQNIKMRQYRTYFEINSGVVLPGIQNNTNENIAFDLKSDFSYSASLSLGTYIIDRKKTRLDLIIGLEYSSINYSLSFDSLNYSYGATDPDNFNYTRRVFLEGFNERSSIQSMSIPIRINYLKRIGQFYSGIGLSYQVNYILNSEYSSSSDINYGGYYPELFNIYINDNGVYDFGNYSVSDKQNFLESQLIHRLGLSIITLYELNPRYSLVFSLGRNISLNSLKLGKQEYISRSSEELNSFQKVFFNEMNITTTEIKFGLRTKI